MVEISERIEVSGAGVSLTGVATRGDQTDRPLLLLVHGGGVNAHYFAATEDSMLAVAAANGFAAVAVNRPGYADSDRLGDEEASFARQAEVIDAATDELWSARAEGRPGVVVCGHSIGGAVSVHLAARRPSWPLLGISITGLSLTAPPFLVELWESMARGQRVEFSPEASGTIQIGNAPSESERLAAPRAVWQEPTPSGELLEVATRWPSEFPAVAAEVVVPVQYAVGERDKLWLVTDTTAADCAALFTNAPYVDAQLLPGVGHAIEHEGTLGRSHCLRQLSFALRCTGPRRAGTRSRPGRSD